MKKIIAAALSILVGAFGYTIVDNTVEDRIASLESQVAELQAYHTKVEASEIYTTENYSSDVSVTYTETTNPNYVVGQKRNWNLSGSVTKFLIRVYSDDSVCAYSPDTLNAIEESTMIDNNADKEIVDEHYLYITAAYSEITKVIEKEMTTRIEFDDDFSTTIHTEMYKPNITYKVVVIGRTDDSLKGRMIERFYCTDNSTYWLNGEAKISEDGLFEFVSVEQNRGFNKVSGIYDMKIK